MAPGCSIVKRLSLFSQCKLSDFCMFLKSGNQDTAREKYRFNQSNLELICFVLMTKEENKSTQRNSKFQAVEDYILVPTRRLAINQTRCRLSSYVVQIFSHSGTCIMQSELGR